MLKHSDFHFVSATTIGEKCFMCGKNASHKVGEEIANDDPFLNRRHNFTSYVCCEHFAKIFGKAVFCNIEEK